MSESFDFREPGPRPAGAIGEPGRRIFFFQARDGRSPRSFKVEKQQVAALGEYLGGILADLPPAEGRPVDVQPATAEPAELAVGRSGPPRPSPTRRPTTAS